MLLVNDIKKFINYIDKKSMGYYIIFLHCIKTSKQLTNFGLRGSSSVEHSTQVQKESEDRNGIKILPKS